MSMSHPKGPALRVVLDGEELTVASGSAEILLPASAQLSAPPVDHVSVTFSVPKEALHNLILSFVDPPTSAKH